jgi:hypothetical protein
MLYQLNPRAKSLISVGNIMRDASHPHALCTHTLKRKRRRRAVGAGGGHGGYGVIYVQLHTQIRYF